MDFIKENKVNLLLGVCAILLISVIYLIATGNGSNNGNIPNNSTVTNETFHVSEKTISDLEGLLEDLIYLNTGTKGDVVYTTGKYDGDYKVLTFVIGENVQDIYVSKDEKYILQAPPILISEMLSEIAIAKVEMEQYLANQTLEDEKPTEITKTEKPVVELFVMSYCPYGLQAQKALLPVAKLLGDKADIKVRFVSYIMHPSSGETQENLRQHCMQKEGMNYWNYLDCFVVDGNTSKCLVQAGIDSSVLDTCYSTEDEKYSVTALLNDKSTWLSGSYPQFNVDKELNTKYGVQGSPTFVVNGVIVNAARNPEAFKDAICNAFSTTPEECNTELSTTNMPAMFGYEGTGGNTGSC